MQNRHRFWNRCILGIAAALFLSSCVAPPPRPPGVQRAPKQSQTLAAGATITDPYSNIDASAGEATIQGSQKTVKVAMLLPLTGRNADLGRALQDAGSVSLFDKYARLSISQQKVRVELEPFDTGDTPQQASRAMEEAMKAGAEFIIGPLFADATSVAAPIARAKNISVLSLSNTRTQASPGTYMFGFSPAEQADRIVNYALATGKMRIAVLVPNSALGETVLTAARSAIESQGLRLAGEAKYLVQGAGIESALNQLVRPGYPPGFDAILIPEGGPALETIMRGLNARGVKPSTVKFLGTGLWDDAELLRRVNLESAWFASSPPDLTSQFEARFSSTYGYAPPRIASLAYDAVALAVTLATSGRPFDTVTLTNPAGFSGPANGIFRLRATGAVQRGLAVMEVHGGGLKVISPSPSGF